MSEVRRSSLRRASLEQSFFKIFVNFPLLPEQLIEAEEQKELQARRIMIKDCSGMTIEQMMKEV